MITNYTPDGQMTQMLEIIGPRTGFNNEQNPTSFEFDLNVFKTLSECGTRGYLIIRKWVDRL